jgi:hypothetical protein
MEGDGRMSLQNDHVVVDLGIIRKWEEERKIQRKSEDVPDVTMHLNMSTTSLSEG